MYLIPAGFCAGDTLHLPFATYAGGASITCSGLATSDIEVYKNGSTTQRASDNGYALLDTDGIDFDGATGIHGFSIDTSDDSDSGFWVDAATYWILVNAITVDGQTVRFVYFLRLGPVRANVVQHGGHAVNVVDDGGGTYYLETFAKQVNIGGSYSALPGSSTAIAVKDADGYDLARRDQTYKLFALLARGDAAIATDCASELNDIINGDYGSGTGGYDPTAMSLEKNAYIGNTNQSAINDIYSSLTAGINVLQWWNPVDEEFQDFSEYTKNVLDILRDMLQLVSGPPTYWRWHANSLEEAPAGGGGGGTDWTADEKTVIKAVLGIPGSGTTPADPTSGILDTIRDELAKVPKSDGSSTWNATALGSINAQCDTALADYDGPTKAEMDAGFDALNQSASRRITVKTNLQWEVPESGSSTFDIEVRCFDGDGALVNADSTPTVTVVGKISGSLAANLGAGSNPSTGIYKYVYTLASGSATEPATIDASASIGGSTFTESAYPVICDFVAANFSAADRTKLEAIHAKLPSKARIAGTDNSSGAIELNTATGALPTDSITAAALAADAVTEMQSGLAGASALAAAKAILDKLDTALESDGGVYRFTTNALEQAPGPGLTASAIWNLADGIETGVTPKQALQRIAATTAGKLSGAGTATETFVGLDGVTTRVTVTLDSSNNRTTVVYA